MWLEEYSTNRNFIDKYTRDNHLIELIVQIEKSLNIISLRIRYIKII